MTLLKKNKSITYFRPKIRSRHPSHDILRGSLPRLLFKSVIRLGSTTDMEDTVSNGGTRVEINTIQSIRNSSNKSIMKQKFHENGVKTAIWNRAHNAINITEDFVEFEGDLNDQIEFPLVLKHIYGSRGMGNTLIKSKEEYIKETSGKDLSKYIIEKYYGYTREYRLHVTKDECFYTCRKMLKSDTPEDKRWFRNDSNSIWVLEENEQFDKPTNWNDVVSESIKALKSVGLDVGAVDLKIQSSTKNNGSPREYPEFIVIEINSAPSFGEITAVKYKEKLVELLKNKHG